MPKLTGLSCILGAAAAPAAAAAAPASAAAPAPAAAAPAAAPAAPRPLTAVEQRGPRVYASPMAKRLAEAQQLRLEGRALDSPALSLTNQVSFGNRTRKRSVRIDHQQGLGQLRRRDRLGSATSADRRRRVRRYSGLEHARGHRQAPHRIEEHDSPLLSHRRHQRGQADAAAGQVQQEPGEGGREVVVQRLRRQGRRVGFEESPRG